MVKGLRISDSKESVLSVTLANILNEIEEKELFWSILFVDGVSKPGERDFLTAYEEKVNQSENGLLTTKKNLLKLSNRYFQMYETAVIASQNKDALHKYETDKSMFENCEISIVLVDCMFWEFFSYDQHLIDRLKNTFKDVKELDSSTLQY